MLLCYSMRDDNVLCNRRTEEATNGMRSKKKHMHSHKWWQTNIKVSYLSIFIKAVLPIRLLFLPRSFYFYFFFSLSTRVCYFFSIQSQLMLRKHQPSHLEWRINGIMFQIIAVTKRFVWCFCFCCCCCYWCSLQCANQHQLYRFRVN